MNVTSLVTTTDYTANITTVTPTVRVGVASCLLCIGTNCICDKDYTSNFNDNNLPFNRTVVNCTP